MGRLIDIDDSRNHYIGMDGEYERWNIDSNVLEEAQPEPQWIPCSELLPIFDFTDVLVCLHDVRHGCEDDYYIASAYRVGETWEMTLNVDMHDFEVVAWMPLPEPWRGEE